MRDTKAVSNQLILAAQARVVRLGGQQLQGLIYLAHASRLALLSEPLIDRAIYAVAGGISIPVLNRAGLVGEQPVLRPVGEIVCRPSGLLDEVIPVLEKDDPACEALERVLEHFCAGGTAWLQESICKSEGPWHQVWYSPDRVSERLSAAMATEWGAEGYVEKPAVIPNSLIREWFRARLIRRKKQRMVEQGEEPTVRLSYEPAVQAAF